MAWHGMAWHGLSWPGLASPGMRACVRACVQAAWAHLTAHTCSHLRGSPMRRHRWFTESLPLYLSVTPDQIMSQYRALDNDVLNEVVMKIGFDRQELLDALQART